MNEWAIVALREIPAPGGRGCSPLDCARYWRDHIETAPGFNPCVELLAALLVNTKLELLGHHVVATGTLNEVVSHPRECFRAAIIGAAYAVVLMHNHPSGDPMPSTHDARMTARMRKAGEIVGIPLLDHVIVGRTSGPTGCFSFRANNLIFKVDTARRRRTRRALP